MTVIRDVVAHLKQQKIQFFCYTCNVLFHHYMYSVSSILLSTCECLRGVVQKPRRASLAN